MRKSCVWLIIPLIVLVLAQLSTGVLAKPSSDSVVVATFNVPVDPGSSEFVKRVVQYAIDQNASAIVITMNTPGGLLGDMVSIVS